MPMLMNPNKQLGLKWDNGILFKKVKLGNKFSSARVPVLKRSYEL